MNDDELHERLDELALRVEREIEANRDDQQLESDADLRRFLERAGAL